MRIAKKKVCTDSDEVLKFLTICEQQSWPVFSVILNKENVYEIYYATYITDGGE